MANENRGDFWGQPSVPATAEQQAAAKQAAAIERDWEADAQKIAAVRAGHRGDAKMLGIAGGVLLVLALFAYLSPLIFPQGASWAYDTQRFLGRAVPWLLVGVIGCAYGAVKHLLKSV